MPQIEGQFNVKVQINHANGTPYEGFVRMNIFKKHCDGSVKGDWDKSGTTDDNGPWDSHYVYTYKFANLRDKVANAWYAELSDGIQRIGYEEVYYESVSSSNYYIDKTYSFIIP